MLGSRGDGGKWEGAAGPALALANDMSASPGVFNWKQGNGSADVSILELPREGG